jgi:hypothetical protein
LTPGQILNFGVVAKNENGGTTLGGTITYMWALSNSGCGSLSSTNTADTVYTAGDGCSTNVTVHAQQDGSGQVDGPTTSITVNATPPAPPPEVIDVTVDSQIDSVLGTEIAVIAALVSAGLSWDAAEVVAAAVGGSKEVTLTVSADKTDLPVGTKLRFPSNATGQVIIVTITAASSDTPGLQSSYLEAFSSSSELGAILGSSSIDVSIFDEDGNPLENFRLDKPAEVCLPYTDEDLATAYGGIDGMAVYHYNGVDWVKTNSSVDLNNKLVCGYSSTFSPFALGLAEAPPAPPGEAGLPVTGDYAPGMSTLVLALMAGIALVGTGVFTVRRTRRVRENG